MTITTTDIGNRALQMLGTRTTMASLSEASNEAAQISLCLAAIENWCFGLANWNFARSAAALTSTKGPPPSPPGTWNVNTYAAPPWLYQYALPGDYIRALYLTNNDANAGATAWLGEPKRFVIVKDFTTNVPVLLTNESAPILVYTAFVVDPTNWPWYFERLMVLALANTICQALTGSLKLNQELSSMLEQQISIATQVNTAEGLTATDATPEWIQAIGINYPFRRLGEAAPASRQPRHNEAGQ